MLSLSASIFRQVLFMRHTRVAIVLVPVKTLAPAALRPPIPDPHRDSSQVLQVLRTPSWGVGEGLRPTLVDSSCIASR